jgi:hypothetical protein
MSKHHLEARQIYHHTRESIEAHGTIVFAGQSSDRTPNLLEHQEIRAHRTPPPHRDDPSRTTNTDRRRIPTR